MEHLGIRFLCGSPARRATDRSACRRWILILLSNSNGLLPAFFLPRLRGEEDAALLLIFVTKQSSAAAQQLGGLFLVVVRLRLLLLLDGALRLQLFRATLKLRRHVHQNCTGRVICGQAVGKPQPQRGFIAQAFCVHEPPPRGYTTATKSNSWSGGVVALGLPI